MAMALVYLFMGDTAAAQEFAATNADAGPPKPVEELLPEDAYPEITCDKPGSSGDEMLDKVQRGVYSSVCNTALWFDGLFGTRRFDRDTDETFGRLSVGGSWDDYNGFDDRIRLRARVALPTAKRRLSLLVGRANDKDARNDAEAQDGGTIPSSFQNVEDDAWLLGLGYSKQGGRENGFDFGAGIRVRTPVDPYTKATYQYNFVFGDDTTALVRQTVFWRDSRGWGESTDLTFDHLINERLLLRFNNGAGIAEDVERLEWFSALTTFQSLGNRAGLAYSTFISGISNTDVPVRTFGAEVRFRRRVSREWLFVELRTGVSWPKSTLDEERKINPGVGIGFEMYFGPVPELEMR